MSKFIFILIIFLSSFTQAQTINMYFPAFAGKTYDLIIFQGSATEAVIKDTIPADGRFQLVIPQRYAPYTGMCRWLITNSEYGGGIDMAIPGHDFSISCLSDKPDNDNIKYEGYDPVNTLNKLYNEQQVIVDKYKTMSRAKQLYTDNASLSTTFSKEATAQQQAFSAYRDRLASHGGIVERMIPILSIANGVLPELTDDDGDNATILDRYMTSNLNYDDLFVSGHWVTLIQSWIAGHMQSIQSVSAFTSSYQKVSDKITDPIQYTDFIGKVTYFINLYGKDEYIEAIAPIVINSGKVTEYLGSLSVYTAQLIGKPAPPLYLPNGDRLLWNDKKGKAYDKTIVLFFDTDCGHCTDVIKALKNQYTDLQKKKIRIIALGADNDVAQFHKAVASYPWKESYCDGKGMNGTNFKNYGVPGTPTLFLIDNDGIILNKTADLQTLFNKKNNNHTLSLN